MLKGVDTPDRSGLAVLDVITFKLLPVPTQFIYSPAGNRGHGHGSADFSKPPTNDRAATSQGPQNEVTLTKGTVLLDDYDDREEFG